MAIPNKLISPQDTVGAFCDGGIVFSLGALIFVLPISIAFLDSFAALAVIFYFIKKINRMCLDWPNASRLNFLGKVHFIWKGLTPPISFLNRPLQFLALAFFISVLFSQYPKLSLLAFMGKFLKSIFVYFSFIEAFTDEKRVRMFLILFLASAFIIALNGAVQHYLGKDFLKGHFIPTDRINSSFFGANGFGAYLLPVIGLVSHFLFTAFVRRKSWIWSGVLTCFIVLLLACLCWTYSRSSWVGFLVILLVMWLVDHRKALFAGSLLLVFIFIFLPSLNNVRHMHLINDNSGGTPQKESFFTDDLSVLEHGGSGRFAFWTNAFSIIRSSPIYGTGLNTYAKIIQRNPDKKTWLYAHNCYIQLTAETGLLGLAFFLWLLFVLLHNGLNYCKQINDPWVLTCLQGTVAGLFGFLVQSFFDNTFYTVQLGMLMWVMIGLMVAVTRLKSLAEQRPLH